MSNESKVLEWDNAYCYVPGSTPNSTHTVALGSKYFGAGDLCAESTRLQKGKYSIELHQPTLSGTAKSPPQKLLVNANIEELGTQAVQNNLLINSKCRLLPQRKPSSFNTRTTVMPKRFKFSRAVSCSCNHWQFRLFATWKLKKETMDKLVLAARIAERSQDFLQKQKTLAPLLSMLTIKELNAALLSKENAALKLPNMAMSMRKINGSKQQYIDAAAIKLTVADVEAVFDSRQLVDKGKCKHMNIVDSCIVKEIEMGKKK